MPRQPARGHLNPQSCRLAASRRSTGVYKGQRLQSRFLSPSHAPWLSRQHAEAAPPGCGIRNKGRVGRVGRVANLQLQARLEQPDWIGGEARHDTRRSRTHHVGEGSCLPSVYKMTGVSDSHRDRSRTVRANGSRPQLAAASLG